MKISISFYLIGIILASLLLSGCSKNTVDPHVPAPESEKAEEITQTPAAEPEPEAPPEPYEASAAPLPDEVWIPREAPAVRNTISEDTVETRIAELLSENKLLYSGKTNAGHYPKNPDWLKNAEQNGALLLRYACDDVSHGGWGVLGLTASASGSRGQQWDIPAYGERPDRERYLLIPMSKLCELAGVESILEVDSFGLGAWNGGRIAALYYLTPAQAEEYSAYMAEVEEAEAIMHTYSGTLSNTNAIEPAKVLYEYLKDIYGNACLTGQMESTWMGTPEYEMNYIEEKTGKLPALRGFDFMNNDFAGVTARAKTWWERGGLVTICWHTGADFASGYSECLADNINWDEAFLPGSDAYLALLAGMDRAVPYLRELQDAGVPVLWRPFHELDGGWFWWSKGGSENFVKLWQLMYSRYTDYWSLNNLIWVYGYSQNGQDMAAWYPGDCYVDLMGADSYTAGANNELYIKCTGLAPEGMPIVFHECGTVPTEEELLKDHTGWIFFMTWHTTWITDEASQPVEALKSVYQSDYFITLDELPCFSAP